VKPGFTENWWPVGKRTRTHTAVTFARPALVFGAAIEIGCWEGRSSVHIANWIAPRTLHCVDHFKGDLHRLDNGVAALAQTKDVRARFLLNVETYTSGNVVLHPIDWREFAAEWSDPIGLLHIDAEHTYEDVFDTIAWALPLVVEGGVIVGDDYVAPGVRRAVRECLPDARSQASTWWWQK